MEIVSLVVAIVALVVAVLAYIRTGGIQDLRRQVSTLGTSTEALRSKTADVLERLERTLRGSRQNPPPAPPGESPGGQKRESD
ncbi:MAG: hypothetical protein ACE5G5_02985 [Candidatus Methylomirabilales bacterium]